MIKNFLYFILISIGIFGIISTAYALIVSESLTIGPIFPGIAGVLLVAFSTFMLLRKKPLFGNRTLRIIITVIVGVGVLIFCFIESFIITYACADKPENTAGFVIVPGCGIHDDGSLTQTLKNRLDAALHYLNAHKDAVCIVSGGQGENEPMPEALAMKDYLLVCGIDPCRILIEPDSTSTSENMAYSAALIRTRYPDRAMRAVVATSDFHMFRAILLARHHGIDASGLSAPTPWYVSAYCYVRESLAVANTVLFQLD